MSYQVLALKWRPKKFQDVIGQKHITKSLQNSLVKKKLGHAYIFSGTRGVGKTTIARIFAKSVRCENRGSEAEPCGVCPSCLEVASDASMNVMEIDGASNNSVENIRELIGNIHYLPTRGEYKVYIIDEVHMLSVSAFNALLKTLEEPPKHVIFLMATTEPEKLLGTVLSRCQRFDCRNVSLEDLIGHVQKISQKEEITFSDPKIIKQICIQGKGSVRDTLSLLDQVLSFSDNNHIDEEGVALSLGLARLSLVKSLTSSLLEGDVKGLSVFYKKILLENVPVKNIMVAIQDYFYELIQRPEDLKGLVQEGLLSEELRKSIDLDELIWIFEVLSKDMAWVLETFGPEKVFEIALQKVCLRRTLLNKKPIQKSSLPEEEKKKPTYEKQARVAPDIKHSSKEPPLRPKERKTWKDFFLFLEKASPATASNLEQGNILKKMDVSKGGVEISYGFKESASVFWEHLNSEKTKSNLIRLMSEFFSVSQDKIYLDLKLVKKNETSQSQFLSVAEKQGQKDQLEKEERRRKLINHPLVKEAEKIFNSHIDKVILK
mgnify:CR=1 FL=1